jgi:hypothetical protein
MLLLNGMAYTDSFFLQGLIFVPRFQIATESQGGNTGTTDSQNYYNITLRLRTPDPGLGAKFRTTGKIEADRPVTTDGGQTWTIKHVMIPAMVNGKALVPT